MFYQRSIKQYISVALMLIKDLLIFFQVILNLFCYSCNQFFQIKLCDPYLNFSLLNPAHTQKIIKNICKHIY